MRFGEGGRDTPLGVSDRGVEADVVRGDERPSSMVGNAMFPARLRSAFAKEDVRRNVLVTPFEIVPPIVSLRVTVGRLRIGEGGCWPFSECVEGTRVRVPSFVSVAIGGSSSVESFTSLNGDCRSSAMM